MENQYFMSDVVLVSATNMLNQYSYTFEKAESIDGIWRIYMLKHGTDGGNATMITYDVKVYDTIRFGYNMHGCFNNDKGLKMPKTKKIKSMQIANVERDCLTVIFEME